MNMEERKIKILEAIITDYINSGEPIGSRTIAKKYDLGISSATIRNEMADLEEMGYLEHIHTSSGRKPSDKGYRLYVDKLMQLPQLTSEEQIAIKGNMINSALYEVEKAIKQASMLLSELTKLTCIVKIPSVKKSYLKTIQLIFIDNISILLIIVTDSGIIKNNLIRISKQVDGQILQKLNNALNSRLKNLTVEEINLEVINNVKADLCGYEDIFNAIIPVLYDTLKNVDPGDVFMEGEANILHHPEYNDIERAREFITFVNDKEKLKLILDSPKDISISIGGENQIPEAKDCTIITKVYMIGDRPIGSIGLIGPTRMQYSKVITLLSTVIKEINDNLNKSYNEW